MSYEIIRLVLGTKWGVKVMTFLGRLHLIVLAFLLSVFFPASASAVPTELVVRILAKDAKFIGTEVGGIKVTVSDSDTGAVLAQGHGERRPGQYAVHHERYTFAARRFV
jgi:ABC-type glycerol-3-phosphate transport system permease component